MKEDSIKKRNTPCCDNIIDMEISEIPSHIISSDLHPEVVLLRKAAPNCFVSLIESCKLGNVESIRDIPTSYVSVLQGGARSACFLLHSDNRPVVIKLRNEDTEDEAVFLEEWAKVGASTPSVISHGKISATVDIPTPVNYIVIEVIKQADGQLSKSGKDFLINFPERISELGREMGKVLATMHKTQSNIATFTTEMDENGRRIKFNNWRDFLLYQINTRAETLSETQMKSFFAGIENVNFPKKPSLVHNDFGLHNILVPDYDLKKMTVIDPNPLFGDPYWDIATQANYLEVKRFKSEINSNNNEYFNDYQLEEKQFTGLIEGYQQKGVFINKKRLILNQIAQMYCQLNTRERIAKDDEYFAMQKAVGFLAESI